jgi:hypothetical protein
MPNLVLIVASVWKCTEIEHINTVLCRQTDVVEMVL